MIPSSLWTVGGTPSQSERPRSILPRPDPSSVPVPLFSPRYSTAPEPKASSLSQPPVLYQIQNTGGLNLRLPVVDAANLAAARKRTHRPSRGSKTPNKTRSKTADKSKSAGPKEVVSRRTRHSRFLTKTRATNVQRPAGRCTYMQPQYIVKQPHFITPSLSNRPNPIQNRVLTDGSVRQPSKCRPYRTIHGFTEENISHRKATSTVSTPTFAPSRPFASAHSPRRQTLQDGLHLQGMQPIQNVKLKECLTDYVDLTFPTLGSPCSSATGLQGLHALQTNRAVVASAFPQSVSPRSGVTSCLQHAFDTEAVAFHTHRKQSSEIFPNFEILPYDQHSKFPSSMHESQVSSIPENGLIHANPKTKTDPRLSISIHSCTTHDPFPCSCKPNAVSNSSHSSSANVAACPNRKHHSALRRDCGDQGARGKCCSSLFGSVHTTLCVFAYVPEVCNDPNSKVTISLTGSSNGGMRQVSSSCVVERSMSN